MNISCPAIARIRKTILKEVSQLKATRDRIKNSANERATLAASLESLRADLAKMSARHTELETAPALALHRMGLSPDQAQKESDQLQAKIATASERDAELSRQIAQLESAKDADTSTIERAIEPLIRRCQLVSQAELIAWLSAITEDFDVAYSEEHNWHLFQKTIAHRIYRDRLQRLKHTFSWEVAEEVLEEPIVPLEQRPAELPNTPGSAICREVHAS